MHIVPKIFKLINILTLCSMPVTLLASHIVGGNFSYTYLGDTAIAGSIRQKYEISLYIYQDCINGVPDAIAQDNPAYLSIYTNGTLYVVDTSVYYNPAPASGGAIVVPPSVIAMPCGEVSAANWQLCLLRKRFSRIYYLPLSTTGYTVAYRRCCRSANLVNLVNPGDYSIDFFCTIPASAGGTGNTSAVFKNYPPQVVCLTTLGVFDHSATDADGDSLSYEICPAYGTNGTVDIKPKVAPPPPYDAVAYLSPYSAAVPIPGIGIDARTGELSINPSAPGNFQVGIICREWRNGVQINAVIREFQWMCVNCGAFLDGYRPSAGANRSVLVGDTIQFSATGATAYQWWPATYLNNASIPDPVGTFTQPGEYMYVLSGQNDKGCSGNDTLLVQVLEHSGYTAPNAFTPNGDGHNDVLIPISVINSKLNAFRVYNRWGIPVFFTTTTGEGWDGTYNGREQETGVYTWTIEYTDNKGTVRMKKGNTTLLR